MGRNSHGSSRLAQRVLEIERMGHLQQHRPVGSLIVAGPVENKKHIIPGPVDVVEAKVQIVNILSTLILKGGGGKPHVGEVITKNTVDQMRGDLSLRKRNIIKIILDPDAEFIADKKVGIEVCGKAVSPPEILLPNAQKGGKASPSESPEPELGLIVFIDTGKNE